MTREREQWGSRVGFILAAAGSTVGLGNIWRFPYVAGQNGGAAFTLVYLACLLVVALPILLAEFAIGRKTQLNPVGAFRTLAKRPAWKWVGFLGVSAAFVILAFYAVVGGWTMNYTWLAIKGTFNEFVPGSDLAGQMFDSFTTSPIRPVVWHLIFMGLCILIIAKGVKGGIERWSKILMPLLLAILLILVIRGITLKGSMEGIRFLFQPKWGDLGTSGVMQALGQSFFTMSLGMGAMITYGSYLRRDSDLVKSAFWVIILDTSIALLAGVAIFSAVFAFGQNPAGGDGLVFMVLPTLFPQIPGGRVFAVFFFFLLFVAALTSAISILEVVTAYFIDEKKWSRPVATYTFGGIIALVGVFASLSKGEFNILNPITQQSFFSFLEDFSAGYMLPIGGLLTAIFILVQWKVPNFIEELRTGSTWFKVPKYLAMAFFIIAGSVVAYILFDAVLELFTS
ncbi:MAG: sodium-dependent transporter [Candidatus Neomarinimicrobiota bacterium]